MKKNYFDRLQIFHLSFPNHDGRPGEQGGSVPRDASTVGYISDPISSGKALSKAGNKFGVNKKDNINIAIEAWKSLGVNARVLSKDDPKFIRDGIKSKGAAYYYNYDGKEEIVINPYNEYWKNPKEYTAKNYSLNRFSSDDPARTLIHEYGHYRFSETNSADHFFSNNSQLRDIVKIEVSQYAATNSREFVAEVYAGLVNGKTYSQKVMTAYNDYKVERIRR